MVGYICLGIDGWVHLPGYRWRGTTARVKMAGYICPCIDGGVNMPGYRWLGTFVQVMKAGYWVHMGHRAQDGKKVDEMSLFKKKYEAGTDR